MPDNPPQPDAATLTEDVEDLKAHVRAITTQLGALAAGGPPPTSDRNDPNNTEGGEEDEGFPPFILLLDPPEYETELRALTEWVEGVLVPGYLAEASADARWCHLWPHHPVAVARLHALWLAWQELTAPETCGYTGPSTWHRDHYDPCIRELRASTGPFQGCTRGEHQVEHRLPTLVPRAWTHESAPKV
ncbi:DUF4913 domain-containing protein (plasmid) [Streptomyces sp. NBC_01213]|uniref:DUF4913 domain-containing protein n=1 Tax=Streptomyces sp. NBC_01213 TaxID=2903776 RepID=UPI002F91AC4A|nr:DUF4913 domain-containing protein [Streptomyces sp. NBC_01213]